MKFESVPESDWKVDPNTPKEIRQEINENIEPLELLEKLTQQAAYSFSIQKQHKIVAGYDEEVGDESKRDYTRFCLIVSIESQTIFNQFFNGGSGYRAMYWRAPSTGEKF